jgi:two-component system, cell cycle response regulator
MGKKLLVADDSLTIQKVIKLALSGDIYEIQTVSDGNDALQQISIFHPDAVLIDVGIPGRSAFEVKKAMNEDHDFRNIPVILMSSAFEKVDEAKVALLQFEGRLTKPFDPTHLRQALTQALSLREALAPSEKEPSLQFNRDVERDPPTRPNVGEKRERTREIQVEEKTKTFTTLTTVRHEPTPSFELSPPTMRDVTRDFPKPIDLPELEPIALGIPEESDIKHLTESTVRMSNLDEFDSWNIGESSKNDAPFIDLNQKPMSEDQFLENNKMNFDFGVDGGTKGEISFDDILPPKFNQSPAPQNQSSLAPTRIDLEMPQRPASYSQDSSSYSSPLLNPSSMNALPPGYSTVSPASAPTPAETAPTAIKAEAIEAAMNSDEVKNRIETLVRSQVEKSIELMAKKGLPDIAEKVIRQEIRRILESLN